MWRRPLRKPRIINNEDQDDLKSPIVEDMEMCQRHTPKPNLNPNMDSYNHRRTYSSITIELINIQSCLLCLPSHPELRYTNRKRKRDNYLFNPPHM